MSSERSHRTAAWLAAGVLLAILAVFFHREVFLGEQFSPADLLFSHSPWREQYGEQPPSNRIRSDDVFLIYPVMASAWARLKQGEWPAVDPGQLAGAGAFLERVMVGLALYPLAIVYYLFSPGTATTLFAIARLWLAGLFMFLYCRRLDLVVPASLVAAVTFMLNGHFVVWLSSTLPNVAIWLPLALLAAEHLLDRPGVRTTALFALALAPQYLGGYVPTAAIASLIVGAYLVNGAVRRGNAIARLRWGLAGAVLALAIGALGVAPTAISLWHSDLATRAAGLYVYPPRNLLTFVYPDFWGTPVDRNWWHPELNYCEAVTYLGLAPLILAPIGAAISRDSRRWFFLALAGFVLADVYGMPGVHLVGTLPVLRSINNFRWVVGLSLATSVLAGLAVDGLLRARAADDHRRLRAAQWMALAAAVMIMGGYATISLVAWDKIPAAARASTISGGLRGAGFLAIGVAIVWWMSRRVSAAQRWAGAVLVVLIGADLISAQADFNPSLRGERLYPWTPALSWLRERADTARVAFVGDPPVGLMPGALPEIYGLSSIGGYDFAGDTRYQRFLRAATFDRRRAQAGSGYVFLNRSLDPESPLLDLLHVRFIASTPDIDLFRWRQIAASLESDTTTGEIVDGRAVGQTFVCPIDGLSRIAIYPATYGRSNVGTLVFHLREENGAHDLVERVLPTERLVDNAEVEVDFPPRTDSRGKRYRFWVESPGAAGGNAVTVWATSRDEYSEGTRLEGVQQVAGDLKFRAYGTVLNPSSTLREGYRGDLNILENLDVQPKAWLVRNLIVDDGESAVARLARGLPLATSAIVERLPSMAIHPGSSNGDRLDLSSSRPEQMVAEVAADRPALLVVSQRFDPRWRAAIDGRETELLRTNEVLCGVPVPAGRHTVTLVYRDQVVRASGLLTALAFGTALLMLLPGRRAT